MNHPMAIQELNYISFASKYRPKNFTELRGQEVLTKTLGYCISNNKISQAILLSGIRGVGKTSSARIVAKTINCTNLVKQEDIVLPCENCENCLSFNKKNHPDIIEFDAASKTKTEDIKSLVESSEYKPLLGQFRIYIIDEVHMLAKGAFNSLLKLIEEPPPHVIFIFATTEVKKIPLTVISRCQRYDLRRLVFTEIYNLLQDIASNEKLDYSKKALEIITIKSEGSARDATVMLDQAASFAYQNEGEVKITEELVNKMLGLVESKVIVNILQLIIANKPKEIIDLLQEIYLKTSNLSQFIQSLSEFIAYLTKIKVTDNPDNVLYQSYQKDIITILDNISLSKLTILWQIFSNGILEIASSRNELISTEMLLIKAMYACDMPDMEELVKIEELLHGNENKSDIASSPNVQKVFQEEEQHFQSEPTNKVRSGDLKFTIYGFLKYCYEQKETQIYYYLLNEVEIINFTAGMLELAGNVTATMIGNIKQLLASWNQSYSWKITTIDKKQIKSLKTQMIENTLASEKFKIIKNNFPTANISDILLEQ